MPEKKDESGTEAGLNESLVKLTKKEMFEAAGTVSKDFGYDICLIKEFWMSMLICDAAMENSQNIIDSTIQNATVI